MTGHPILFTAPMVRGILDGTKTQTRRVIKPQPPGSFESPHQLSDGRWVVTDNKPPHVLQNYDLRCPYGVPGDQLWVRETWGAHWMYDDCKPSAITPRKHRLYYRATPDDDCEDVGRWRPSIHMPRWASRITLDVLDVRVERVQDISEEDAHAEGMVPEEVGRTGGLHRGILRDDFSFVWDGINAKRGYSWASNPWIWVITFRVGSRTG